MATGGLVYNAIMAAKQLEGEGIAAEVWNIPSIKPLDEVAVLEVAKRVGAIVSVEEHQQKGGLGGAIAEFLAQNHPTKQEFIGVADKFGQSGTPLELIEHYGMGISAITLAADKVINR